MGQKRKSFQGLVKDGRLTEENVVEIDSVRELTELLQQTAEDGTMISVTVEVSGHEQERYGCDKEDYVCGADHGYIRS